MPGIESYSHRTPDDSDDLRLARQMSALYRRAIIALNQYVTVKLGVGKAPVAGLLLNYIFADDVLQPEDPAVAAAGREFAALAGDALADRAQELLQNFPVLRRPLLSTLWVKRFIDLAHGRKSVVDALDRSWVFRTYSDNYPLLTAPQYEIAVGDFEQQLEVELADYLVRSHASGSDSSKDSLISALASYAQVLHDALEHETHHENRIHHLGHLAQAARIFTYLHLPDSGISLKTTHHIECCSHGGKLPGDTAKTVRDAWRDFEPLLRSYIEEEHDVGA